MWLFHAKSKKITLSEYGSEWEWDSNTYAHAFDQTTSNGVPYRYDKDSTNTNNVQYYICPNDIETTDGQVLFSGSVLSHQKSCRANAGNAGNWYNWPAATSGGSKSSGSESNSICPTGWQLTVNAATDPKSYYYLIVNAYNISTTGFNDSSIRYLPMSFVRSGDYNQGSLIDRADWGTYWSSTANNSGRAYYLVFNYSYLGLQDNIDKYKGNSVRCVSR